MAKKDTTKPIKGRRQARRPVPLTRLTVAREAAGLTQAQAAKRAGMTQGQWSDLENGRYASPGLDVIKRAANAVGVTVADIVKKA